VASLRIRANAGRRECDSKTIEPSNTTHVPDTVTPDNAQVTRQELAMRSMFARCLCLTAMLGIGLPVASRGQQAADTTLRPADAANIALARRLLHAMHVDDNFVASLEANIKIQRKINSQLPPVFYDSVMARMKRGTPEIVDSIAPLYARGIPGPQLETMIQFFESPAGQTLARQQALLSPELTAIGQRWGVRIASDVARDLVNAGVDLQAH
jgi:hypothetical protein